MILIYSEKESNRLKYILNFVFQQYFGINYELTSSLIDFEKSELPKIFYGNSNEYFSVSNNDFLFQRGLFYPELKLTFWENIPIYYSDNQNNTISFDLFSAIFFQLSRIEEYASKQKDKYGRFEAEFSENFKLGFLEKPIVNLWLEKLKEKLKSQFPNLVFKKNTFSEIVTIDIDAAFYFKEKGFKRTIGGFLKSALNLNFVEFLDRILVLSNVKNDPNDVYDYLHEVAAKSKISFHVFLLMANYGEMDKTINQQSLAFKNCVNTLKSFAEIGIHPGWNSSLSSEIMQNDFQKFEQIVGFKPKKSRQHYLKLTWPDTFFNLLNLGISKEYSLGYASKPGFRAGICSEFSFYDVNSEKELNLKMLPFAFMDGAFKHYENTNLENALQKMMELKNEVKLVNGTFVSLWHNESLSNYGIWKGWKNVFEKMLNN